MFIQVAAAKAEQLEALRDLITRSPGAYRVLIEVVNNGHTKIHELLRRVEANEEFCKAAESLIARGKVERIESSRLVLDSGDSDPTT